MDVNRQSWICYYSGVCIPTGHVTYIHMYVPQIHSSHNWRRQMRMYNIENIHLSILVVYTQIRGVSSLLLVKGRNVPPTPLLCLTPKLIAPDQPYFTFLLHWPCCPPPSVCLSIFTHCSHLLGFTAGSNYSRQLCIGYMLHSVHFPHGYGPEPVGQHSSAAWGTMNVSNRAVKTRAAHCRHCVAA